MDSSFLLIVRVVASLGAVIGLLWFLQRRLGRAGGRRTANLITVLSRKGVGRSASIVIADAEGQRFVLGVTEQSITVLNVADAPAPTIVDPSAPQSTGNKLTASKHSAWSEATSGSILSPKTWVAAKEAIAGRRESVSE